MAALRQIENKAIKCPFCGGRTIKNGTAKNGKELRRCAGSCCQPFTIGVHYV